MVGRLLEQFEMGLVEVHARGHDWRLVDLLPEHVVEMLCVVNRFAGAAICRVTQVESSQIPFPHIAPQYHVGQIAQK